MTKTRKIIKTILLFFILLMADGKIIHAESEEYITISVDAEDDNNDSLMYAIDSDAPEAFTESNTFTIPAGTSHTIYVKDAAGNITTQEYISNVNNSLPENTVESENTQNTNVQDTQDINIELEIGSGSKEEYDYSSILAPAEPGAGTLYDKTVTDNNNEGKVFYTITTAEGDTFYMILDQNQDSDNVYLLNTVTREDLEALTVGDGNTEDSDENDNLLAALQKEKAEQDTLGQETSVSENTKSSMDPKILMIGMVLIGGGIYYYLKVYKDKKNQQMDVMDAMDMEDFTAEEDENDEEIDFEMADDEKQAFIENLINDEDAELLDANPEEYTDEGQEFYATSHKDDSKNFDAEEMSEDIMHDIATQVADFETDYDPELDGEEE